MANSNAFSSTLREEVITKLKSDEFDILIIGGGITGAGIALDATTRGLKVALVEMQDFAAGTSSRSTKLVHGGLRYLKQLSFKIVKEVGQERRIVHHNAPHIVLPEKMILPLTEGGSMGKLTASLALWVYDFLAGVDKAERRKMLTKQETLERIPNLDSEKLKGSAIYYEYKTDDSRLTIEVLKKAVESGATAINYLKSSSFLYNEKGKISGIDATDSISGEKITISSKVTVSATGPWTDEVMKTDNKPAKKTLRHTKGVHLTFSKEKFPLTHAVYFDTSDGRMIFAIPRGNNVYVGTTDTNYKGDLVNVVAEKEDADYIILHTNKNFPSVNLQFDDMLSAWAGLRPLIHKKGKSPSELSRRDEIFISKSGLISIAGGKLTGYRLMAKKIVNIVSRKLNIKYGTPLKKCKTRKIQLAGGEFDFPPLSYKLVEFCDQRYDEAKQMGISVSDFKMLFYRYGTNVEVITNKAFDFYNEIKDFEQAWLKAEIWYCINHEMCQNLADFFIRRTGIALFQREKIEINQEKALEYFISFLEWDADRAVAEKASFEFELSNYMVK